MKSLESSVERRVCKWADDWGIMHAKLGNAGKRGWPDRMFFVPGGRPVFIEFKRKEQTLRKLQKYILERLDHYGYEVYWSNDSKRAIEILQKYLLEGKKQ